MDKESKRKLIIVVFCFSLAIILFYFFGVKGGTSPASFREPDLYYMICTDPQCAETFELTSEEYREIDDSQSTPGIMSLDPPSALSCSACQQQSLFRAIHCEKCDAIFLPDFSGNDYSDRCFECDYSKLEDIAG